MTISKANINKIFEILSTLNPNPKTELIYQNNYTLLVAVILSAQATDLGVNKATTKLFAIVDNPYDMVKLGENKLKNYINSIGLFNSKAKNIIIMSKQLIDNHHGEVPSNFKDLHSLAGVGRKTANVVLNCAFNMPTMPVDTHVQRLANRLDFTQSAKPEQIENDLLKQIPQKWLNKAHHWLILHGRYICKAKNPICHSCPIQQCCYYYKNNHKEK